MKCPNEAKYCYLWPGEPIRHICEQHAPGLQALGNAIGYPVTLINLYVLGDNKVMCEQNIKEENTVRGC